MCLPSGWSWHDDGVTWIKSALWNLKVDYRR